MIKHKLIRRAFFRVCITVILLYTGLIGQAQAQDTTRPARPDSATSGNPSPEAEPPIAKPASGATDIETFATSSGGTLPTAKRTILPIDQHPKSQTGTASFYADKFEGRKTASGEIFRQNRYTAAHNSLPLGTYVKVTYLRNGRSVIVKINDRMHHRNARLIDLSKAAARKLGFVGRGLAKVRVDVIGKKKPKGYILTDPPRK